MEVWLREVTPIGDDAADLAGVGDVLDRIGFEENEIGDSAFLNGAVVASLL